MMPQTDNTHALPANLPQLRFPEFKDAGVWEEVTIGGKVSKVGSGITPNGGDKNYKTQGIPFVRSQNIGWGCLILDDIAFIDNATHLTFVATEIQKDDVLLNITGASIGRSAVADLRVQGGNVNQHVCIIRPELSALNSYYLNQYLLSDGGQKQIDSFQAGGNRQGLNFAQIRSLLLPFPSLPEQQKIAACLTSLDDLITAENQQLEALKTHKKGLMQSLFPNSPPLEGWQAQPDGVVSSVSQQPDGVGSDQTTPRLRRTPPTEGNLPQLRFPEFKDAGVWEGKALGDVSCSISSGKDKNEESGTYSLYGSTGIIGKVLTNSYDGKFILVARVGANAGLLSKVKGKFGVTDNTLVIVLKENIDFDFCFYFLEKSGLNKLVFGSGQPLITGSQLKSLSLYFPPLPEQQKIAACLSSLDDLISAQSQKIEALKQHKKGLMQQLFPIGDKR